MTILNYTGFETGANDSEYNVLSGTASIVASPVKTGGYALRVNPTTTGVGFCNFQSFNASGVQVVFNVATTYIQFNFRYAVKPTSGSEMIFRGRNSAFGMKCNVRIDDAGKLSIYDTSNTIMGSAGSTVLSVDTWYGIRIKVGTGTSGAYEVQIDTGSGFSSELSGTGDLTTSNMAYPNLGKPSNANGNTVDFFFDDYIVADTAYPDENAVVKAIIPTADSGTQTWGDGTGASDYTQVDEIPYGDADYVQSPTTGNPNIGLFTGASMSTLDISGTVSALKLVGRLRENTSVTSASFLRIKSSSATDDSTAVNRTTGLTTSTYKMALVDPNTSTAWTIGALDSVEIGAVENNAVASRLTSILGMVLFVPSTSVDYPIIAGLGTFTLSGQSVVLQLAWQMIAGLGAFVLSGKDVILGIGKTMIASVGDFVLTGKDIMLSLGKGLSADVGAFVLTGKNILFHTAVSIIAEVGSFILTGKNILFSIAVSMIAGLGTFALTGKNIILSVGKTMVAGLGTFTLTGKSILLTLGRVMSVVVGAFTLTGKAIRFKLNGLYVKWFNKIKNVANWINKDKTL